MLGLSMIKINQTSFFYLGHTIWDIDSVSALIKRSRWTVHREIRLCIYLQYIGKPCICYLEKKSLFGSF